MKTRLSIFLLCFCLLLVWLLRVQSYLGEESLVSNPGNISGLLGDGSDARSSGGSMFTDATFANGSSGGDAFSVVGVGGRNVFSSSRRSHAPVFSYARMSEGAAPSGFVASSPQGGSGSPIGHMTSSAEYHSFGGGMVAVGGYASSASNVVASSSSNLVAYSPSHISYSSSPSVYSPISSSKGSMDEVMSVVDQSFAVASSSYVSPLSAEYAYNSYGTASYGGSHNRIGGRQNAPPAGGGGGLGNSWLNWLDNHFGTSTTFNYESALEAYNAMISSWNSTMGDPPTWEQFVAWLEAGGDDGYTKNDHTYNYVPVGNILPLFLMALIYAIVLFVKRNKTAQI